MGVDRLVAEREAKRKCDRSQREELLKAAFLQRIFLPKRFSPGTVHRCYRRFCDPIGPPPAVPATPPLSVLSDLVVELCETTAVRRLEEEGEGEATWELYLSILSEVYLSFLRLCEDEEVRREEVLSVGGGGRLLSPSQTSEEGRMFDCLVSHPNGSISVVCRLPTPRTTSLSVVSEVVLADLELYLEEVLLTSSGRQVGNPRNEEVLRSIVFRLEDISRGSGGVGEPSAALDMWEPIGGGVLSGRGGGGGGMVYQQIIEGVVGELVGGGLRRAMTAAILLAGRSDHILLHDLIGRLLHFTCLNWFRKIRPGDAFNLKCRADFTSLFPITSCPADQLQLQHRVGGGGDDLSLMDNYLVHISTAIGFDRSVCNEKEFLGLQANLCRMVRTSCVCELSAYLLKHHQYKGVLLWSRMLQMRMHIDQLHAASYCTTSLLSEEVYTHLVDVMRTRLDTLHLLAAFYELLRLSTNKRGGAVASSISREKVADIFQQIEVVVDTCFNNRSEEVLEQFRSCLDRDRRAAGTRRTWDEEVANIRTELH